MSSSPRIRAWTGSLPPTAFMLLAAAYFLLPLWWLVVASTKSAADLISHPGLWFSQIDLGTNLSNLFERDGHIYLRWLLNSAIYAGGGATLATLLSTMAGYALAKYEFRGRQAVFSTILASILVPATALTLPVFLLMSRLGLADTYWSVLLPSAVSPFGVYLARIYAAASVPDELLEAGRLDGASEFRIFFTVSLRLLKPALITIFLFQFAGIWNNYMLPLIMLSHHDLYPVTLGLAVWDSQTIHDPSLHMVVISGALVSVAPLVAAFLLLQRYWRSGLAAGSIK
ncbi:carbohydrate ABC transporter permease [Kitasatospora misakiensis]|uniref:Carbohydrate ABC transporter permease n=1 Tax=Kitasatospora misakiensis TaxID=67330 RepID=A0ABW0X627_9ACTN